MRIAVIRNDLSAPLLLADLEQVSRRNDPVDAPGQVRYISYPDASVIEAALADADTGAGATTTGSDISGSLPITITGSSNDDLKVRTSSTAAFTTVTIAAGSYATVDALVAAVNTALAGTGVAAFNGGNDNIVLESLTYGVNSYLETDDVAGGSTANTDIGLTDGEARTMPAASAFATAIGLPGALDVSQATLEAVGATTNTNALEPYYDAGRTPGLADAVAPIFAETDVAIESFLVGMLSGYASASFNPDPRNPAVSAGAAIAVVEDDGATAFATANTVPTVTSATLGSPTAGDVTIAGTGLGKESGDSTDPLRSTLVKVTGDVAVTFHQETIENAGGSVTDTAIVIPAALIPGAAVTTTSVQVQFRQLQSDVEPLA